MTNHEWNAQLDKAAHDAYSRMFTAPYTSRDSETFGVWWRIGYKAALIDVAAEVDKVVPPNLGLLDLAREPQVQLAPGTAWCSCPDETPNEVACVQRANGFETCGVCGGVVTAP
jgi:hypothetical protein